VLKNCGKRTVAWLLGSRRKKDFDKPRLQAGTGFKNARAGRAKMSKSYNNTIALREDTDSVARKIKTMPTDPARVRRDDPGNPANCPVWQLHEVYSDKATQDWVQEGCKSASIGCVQCKAPVIEGVLAELKPMQERAKQYAEDHALVKNVIAEGCEKARKLARETMRDVRDAMGLNYS